MRRPASLLLAAFLVVGVLALAPIGVVPAQDADDGAETNETRPGERLAGSVGAQHAEVDGEVNARAFERALSAAETDDERAAVVAERLERNDERLAELEDRQADLRAQREAGEVREGTYRAKLAVTAAETATVNRTTNRAAVAAAGLPDDVREEHGIDEASVRALQDRARELTGPEVAGYAREIVGDRPGAPFGPADGDRPEDRAGDDESDDRSDR